MNVEPKKDHRRHRRTYSLRTRLQSLFMLLTVLPMLTGLDVLAEDFVAKDMATQAQKKYDHERLCRIAPQYLSGTVIPTIHTLAQSLNDRNSSPLTDEDHTKISNQVDSIKLELKRIHLALLDNFNKQQKLLKSNSSIQNQESSITPSATSIQSPLSALQQPVTSLQHHASNTQHPKSDISDFRSQTISTLNRLQSLVKKFTSTNPEVRHQAVSKVLALTGQFKQKTPINLPSNTTNLKSRKNASVELNSLDREYQLNPPFRDGSDFRFSPTRIPPQDAFPLRANQHSLTLQPESSITDPVSKILTDNRSLFTDHYDSSNHPVSSISASIQHQVFSITHPASSSPTDHSSSPTLLPLSRIPKQPILIAATTDVLSDILTELSDPLSFGAPTANDLVIAPPLLSAGDSVTQLADDLKTPVAIFEYFRNNFVYEAYFCAVKNTEKTLFEQAGNDVDIASAMISVYRAAGVPCRYVYGTIRLTATDAASWLGVDSSQVTELLTHSRIPFENLGTPGIADILIDHVWVKVYVDYLPYRGVTEVASQINNDPTTVGDSWIEIDPSFKQHSFTERRDIDVELGIQSDNFLTNIRSQSQLAPLPDASGISNGSSGSNSDDNVTHLPQVFILNEIIGLANPLAQFMAQNQLTTETVFRERIIIDERYGLLPCTDFYKVDARGAAYAIFPEALTSSVNVTIKNSDQLETLTYNTPLANLLDNNLALSWLPATPDDETKIASWSSVPGDSTPVFQVNVIPQLTLDDTVVAAGSIPDTAGAAQTMQWTFQPAGSDRSVFSIVDAALTTDVSDTVNAGSLSTFVFDAGKVTSSQINTINDIISALPTNPQSQTTNTQLTQILRAIGLNYFYQSDRFAQITAGVLNLYAQRGPSLIRISYGLEVDEIFGLPFSATANTIKTSVVRDSFTTTPISNPQSLTPDTQSLPPNPQPLITDHRSLFTYINALSSSALNANSLQQLFGESAVSPARLLQTASVASVPVYTLTPETDELGNVLTQLNTSVFDDLFLSISPATQQLIVDSLNRGWTVTFTRDPIIHGGLSRDPVIAVDPISGDSGFFLFASGYRANLQAGAEIHFTTPPLALRTLLTPLSPDILPSSLTDSVSDWLYALNDSTTNTGISFVPAITHIKNFLADNQSLTAETRHLNLSSLKTTAAAIALIGRIDDISQQPGIVNVVATDPAIVSPSQNPFSINAITTRTASWNIRFTSSTGQQVRELTPADNRAPDSNNTSRNRLAPPLILSCNPSRFLNGGNVGYYDGALNCYAISLKKKGMLHAKEKIVVYTFYTGLFETSQKKKD